VHTVDARSLQEACQCPLAGHDHSMLAPRSALAGCRFRPM
jgi:hypothetical protein